MRTIRVLAVTPWEGQGTPGGQACGIANYAGQLIDAALGADRDLQFRCEPQALDPVWLQTGLAPDSFDVLWLNYHRGLHSRWHPENVAAARQYYQCPAVITMHDTYGESAPDALCQSLHDLADAFIVHEPCEGLEQQILLRQGVPDWASPQPYDQSPGSWCGPRPILGTCGFTFPWKNFDRLAEVTGEAGWAYVVLSNNATATDVTRWQAANPHTLVETGFRPTAAIVSQLAGCDATAFPYECANSGTSGAVRLGLAARKPVLAFNTCRQFRDLWLDPDGSWAVTWCQDWDVLRTRLLSLPLQRVDPAVVHLAHRDAWVRQGAAYAKIFRSVAEGRA